MTLVLISGLSRMLLSNTPSILTLELTGSGLVLCVMVGGGGRGIVLTPPHARFCCCSFNL